MADDTALQLKISIVGSKPPIWRRVIIPDSLTLANLHQVIQIVMGWENAHLHDFEVRGRRYSEFEQDIQSGTADSTAVTLRSLKLNKKGHTFLYTYDFGDSWRHEIVVEAPRPTDDSVKLPVCVTGRRACPPEDSGGVHRYSYLLEAVTDSAHPDHEELSEWLDPDFDPEAFDVDRVNRILRRVFSEGNGLPVD
jgi:hypothetical protein